jgi:hypothetical protein
MRATVLCEVGQPCFPPCATIAPEERNRGTSMPLTYYGIFYPYRLQSVNYDLCIAAAHPCIHAADAYDVIARFGRSCNRFLAYAGIEHNRQGVSVAAKLVHLSRSRHRRLLPGSIKIISGPREREPNYRHFRPCCSFRAPEELLPALVHLHDRRAFQET